MAADKAVWISGLLSSVLIVLAGCRSPESILSGVPDPKVNRTASTEEMAESIDASLREKEREVAQKPAEEERLQASQDRGLTDKNADGLSIAEQAAAAAVEPFVPTSLSPISPVQRMSAADIPPGYQARIDELERLGGQLAKAAQEVGANFEFDVVYNPKRADCFHTDGGHILVTSAMIERLKTRNQLAVALALEMAEHIRQLEQKRRKHELVDGLETSVAFASGVVVNGQAVDPEPVTPEQIRRTASELLTRAGFATVDLAAVQQDIQGLAADQTVSSKANERPDSADWKGPQPPAAN